jgi:hypothetical protein
VTTVASEYHAWSSSFFVVGELRCAASGIVNMFIANLGGVCFHLFVIFLLAFRRFKNWMTLKARS